jgi:hypothetical protein
MNRKLLALTVILFLFYSCKKEYSQEGAIPSQGSLQTDLGDCLPKVVHGSYVVNQAFTDSNYIDVRLDVAQTGPFHIHTDTVNGYFFNLSGNFINTGINTVRLKGAGIPQTAGDNVFTVYFDSSFCTIQITVAPTGTTQPPSGDHFILTDNSWWSYNTPAGATDSLKRSIAGSVSANGVTYKILKEKNVTGVIDDSLYVQKSGNNYYELNYVDYYTSFYFDNPVIDSILFLKEGLATGDTWSSKEYSDAVGGTPTKVKYVYTCTNANATISLNGKTYTNVYQVTLKVQVSENGGAYTDDVTWINYYAQGIGWIYQKYDDGSNTFDFPIRNYQVF